MKVRYDGISQLAEQLLFLKDLAPAGNTLHNAKNIQNWHQNNL
jgi:hypothetical protein